MGIWDDGGGGGWGFGLEGGGVVVGIWDDVGGWWWLRFELEGRGRWWRFYQG